MVPSDQADTEDEYSDTENEVPLRAHGVSSMQAIHMQEYATNPDAMQEDALDEDFDAPKMAWNPDRPNEHGVSAREATTSLVAAIIGAGVLALPQLPVQGGLRLSIILLLVGCAAMMECASAYYKAVMAHNIFYKDEPEQQIATYEDYGYHAIGAGGRVLVLVVNVLWFMGLCTGYFILMATNFKSLFAEWFDISYQLWVMILLFPLWFLCMLRDMSSVAKLMPIATGGAIVCCIVIVLKGNEDTAYWHGWPEEDKKKIHNMNPNGDFMAIGSLVATLLGAFGMIPNCPSLLDEMKEQRKFKRSAKSAVGICAVLYLGVMVYGYWGYGNFIQSNIVDSMLYHPANYNESLLPMSQWTGEESDIMLPDICSAAVLANLCLSYPLNMVAMFISIAQAECTRGKLPAGSKNNYMMRTVLVLITFGIAICMQEFSNLYALVSSVCAPLLNIVFPLLFGSMIRRGVKAKKSGVIRMIIHFALYLLALFSIIIGFWGSLQNVIEMYT